MAPHSSTRAWEIPGTEEPVRLQSMWSPRIRRDWETSVSLFTLMNWRRKWQSTPVFCLENLRDGGAWWSAVYGVTQSRTWLKWLSSILCWCLSFWLTSLCIVGSSFIHLIRTDSNVFFLMAECIFEIFVFILFQILFPYKYLNFLLALFSLSLKRASKTV